MTIDRRGFLKHATAGAGLALAATSTASGKILTRAAAPAVRTQAGRSTDVVVVGAGAFGMWTALSLVRLGARVTVVDAYGAGNSRQTSGGETRGVRTSYGDRPHGLLWARWAGEAIQRWSEWDEAGRDRLLPRVFFTTGDLIMREEVSPYIEDTRANWDTIGTSYEMLTPDEVSYRWPWIRFPNLGVAVYEPGAGVVRARRAIESVAQVFQNEGGIIRIGRASFGARSGSRLESVTVDGGDSVSASTVIFACGPWFPKMFPQLMGNRLRISMGHVFYFAVPPGDTRFAYPNMPSYGVPGCTGWPALPPDHRGFRVRTGGRPPEDPDFQRSMDPDRVSRATSAGPRASFPPIWPARRSTRRAHAITKAALTGTSLSTRTRSSTTSGLPAAGPPRDSSLGQSWASTSLAASWGSRTTPNWPRSFGSRMTSSSPRTRGWTVGGGVSAEHASSH